jgi:hypothetical protein
MGTTVAWAARSASPEVPAGVTLKGSGTFTPENASIPAISAAPNDGSSCDPL